MHGDTAFLFPGSEQQNADRHSHFNTLYIPEGKLKLERDLQTLYSTSQYEITKLLQNIKLYKLPVYSTIITMRVSV